MLELVNKCDHPASQTGWLPMDIHVIRCMIRNTLNIDWWQIIMAHVYIVLNEFF